MPVSNFKIAIAFNSNKIQRWQQNLISEIIELDLFNKVSLLLFEADEPVKKGLFYTLYEKPDKKLFANNRADDGKNPLSLVDIKDTGLYFDDSVEDIDLLINFCGENAVKKLINRVNYGIISPKQDSPPFFREVYNNSHFCEIAFKLHTRDDIDGKVISRGYCDTMKLSLHKNLLNAACSTKGVLLNLLKKISLNGLGSINPETGDTPALNPKMPVFIAKLLFRAVRRFYEKKFFREQWFIGIRKKEPDKKEFNLIKQPDSGFYADPFIFEHRGEDYIFFEEYPFSTGKGVISCLKIERDGTFSESKVVLERDYHLSYPFIFEYENKIYMMPETSANRSLEIYECIEFPGKWELKKTIFRDILIADASMFKHNGKYWLFATVSENEHSLNDELHVFYSSSPFGEWKAHSLNPVIVDVRTARPAGNLFIEDNQIIRPSQDCSKRYGYALNFNRVEILSENDYRETTVKKILPDFMPKSHAIHTYNCNDRFELIDLLKLTRIADN